MGVLFGGLPMAYWDEMYEVNPDGVEDALKLSLKQLNPGLTPSTVKPFLEIASNKNWYGAPIETRAMQRKEIPDRYNDYTMPIAKSLSRAIYDNVGVYEHASPRKIETFMNSATGGLAKNINNVVNYATKEVESKADLPVVGNLFLRKELYEDIVKVDFDRLALLKQKKVSKTLTSEQALELKN